MQIYKKKRPPKMEDAHNTKKKEDYTAPCAIIESATFMKPAMLAPST